MTERERLAELIAECITIRECSFSEDKRPTCEELADYLLSKSVICSPCKVGDVVWVVYTPKWPANPSDKGKWFMRQDGIQRIIFGAKGVSFETWNMGTMPSKAIGEKLFLTREEAEAALAERQKSK